MDIVRKLDNKKDSDMVRSFILILSRSYGADMAVEINIKKPQERAGKQSQGMPKTVDFRIIQY
jgi:hypothetical protein